LPSAILSYAVIRPKGVIRALPLVGAKARYWPKGVIKWLLALLTLLFVSICFICGLYILGEPSGRADYVVS